MTTPPSGSYGVPQPGPAGPSHVPHQSGAGASRPIGAPPLPTGSGPGVPPPPPRAGGGATGGPGSPGGRTPKRRDPGEDPSARRRQVRPWMLWTGVAVVVALVAALVIGVAVSLGGGTQPVAAPTASGPAGDPTALPTSTLSTATPVQPAPGSTIPITTDVSFPNGMEVVYPSVGTWEQSEQDRQPGTLVLEDPVSGAYLSVLALDQLPSTYRDEDLTRAELNSANAMFVSAALDGDPVPFNISGSGYTLELLAQPIALDSFGDESALVISRIMPGAGTRIQIVVIASAADLANSNSPVMQKLREVTFTVA